MSSAFKDCRLEMRVVIWCGVYVKYERQAPATRSDIEEAVVLKMIILVGYKDREDQAPVEFAQIGGRIRRIGPHDINDLRIGA